MDVLVIGSGGREHAMAWKISQSKLANIIFVAPGNAGTEREKKIKNVDIEANDIDSLLLFAKEKKIDWRWGAKYFESKLIDYDVHSNYGNWMYVSGVGNDPRDIKSKS